MTALQATSEYTPDPDHASDHNEEQEDGDDGSVESQQVHSFALPKLWLTAGPQADAGVAAGAGAPAGASVGAGGTNEPRGPQSYADMHSSSSTSGGSSANPLSNAAAGDVYW
jgi:hypothetical protein